MKNAVLTGCDRGLGLAMTKKLLEEGYRVFAGQYMPDWPELDELKKEYGEQLIIVPMDVSTDESVEKAAEIVKGYTDNINLLMNIAGIMPSTMEQGKRIDKTGDLTIFDKPNTENFKILYNVNSLGPLRVNYNFVPLLIKAEGDKTLVNISSEAGSCSFPFVKRDYQYGYCMTKAALNMQSALLQQGLAPYGVVVLNVHPGYMQSYIIAGEKWTDPNAHTTEYCAGYLYQLIQDKKDVDGHIYYDYKGRKLPW